MHHTRRRSGHGLPNTSMTDVRKAAANDASKHKPSSRQNNASSRRAAGQTKSSKSASSRDSEKDLDASHWYDDERDSFPQYCMTCEKQFVAKDDRVLYCSEACRDYDQEYGTTISTQHFVDSYASSYYATDNAEPRDIIPRASPSRPSSTYFSPPHTPARTSSTLPTSSAIAALRSLSLRDASPPSPTFGPLSSGIWPFSSRSSAGNLSSYARPSSAVFSSTYDNGYYHTGATNYYGAGAGAGTTGMERPLPPRRPGSYSRPKSIELVTPLIGQ